ncbi:30S ribosomal protein S11 [bacterium]|nr:30S ribosomal protein S11 [bacterium]|tara:strand:+ start:7738 stop:8163 length:426 start_codon:yes stop_codon:yes gene_type:complete
MGKKRIKTIQADKLKASKKNKKNSKKRIEQGRAYVQSSYNNTIITFTDNNGDVVLSSSCGALGFRGAKKATPYAASILARDLVEKAKGFGLQRVEVFVKGLGHARDQAIRALAANGLDLLSIKDITPIPHGGCRPRKPRRV